MRFGLYQPFNLTVRVALMLMWVVIALSVIVIGSRSPEPNHPLGLLLLGLGLAGPGLLALMTLASRSLWDRLVDLEDLDEEDVRKAKSRIYVLIGLGVVGLVMLWFALTRLL
jgi:hypothetical protein